MIIAQLGPESAAAASGLIRGNEERICRFVAWQDFTDPAILQQTLLSPGPPSYFMGAYQDDGLVGLVRFTQTNYKRWWNIIYAKGAMAPKGTMDQAVPLAIAWLRRRHPEAIIEAEVDLENTPSLRLLERQGFFARRATARYLYLQHR